jgi:SlyX protein
MTDLKRLSARIDEMEARLSYQDLTIETLNATITGQWKQIDALNRRVAQLGDRLREAEANAPATSGHEPPPHY